MEQNIEQQVTRGLGQNQPFQPKSFPFATEQITLPSKGLCYPENNPLAKGYVTVKLLTAKEEDILTSTSLIRKGATIDRLLESIIVEPGVQVNDLLIGDKNAILVASRVLAYGPVYKVTVTDPFENEPVDVDVDMAKLSTKDVDESKWNRDNEYDFTLPKSKLPIKFKLLTHGDELAISKDIEASEKTLKQSNEITTRWRRIITEINGNRDLGYISNFVINQFQIQDSKALRNYIKEVTPDVDFNFEYTSPFTGEKEALRVPIGVDFFYPAD
jgi:hypothetical protein